MSLATIIGRAWSVVPGPVKRLWRLLPGGIRARLFRGMVGEEAQVVQVQSGLVRGMRMEIAPRVEMGYYWGDHEPDVQALLPKFVRPGMIAFDAGANAGFFALALARLVGPTGRVVAFEPNPAVASRLVRNLALNHLQSLATVEAIAVGDFDGDAAFSFSMTEMQGRFSDSPGVPDEAPKVTVPCRTLDSYSRQTGIVPDLLLVDVEHAEGRVFRGMRNLLATRRPIVIVEMHGPEAIREAYAELMSHGYSLWSAQDLQPVADVTGIRGLGHYFALPPGAGVGTNPLS